MKSIHPTSSSDKKKLAAGGRWFELHIDVRFKVQIVTKVIFNAKDYIVLTLGFTVYPSSIYSCSIGHIWKHEFCHLGCWAVKGKFLKRPNFCLSMLLFGVVFSTFCGQKNNFSIFFFSNFLLSNFLTRTLKKIFWHKKLHT